MYTDADVAADVDKRRSTTGAVMLMQGARVRSARTGSGNVQPKDRHLETWFPHAMLADMLLVCLLAPRYVRCQYCIRKYISLCAAVCVSVVTGSHKVTESEAMYCADRRRHGPRQGDRRNTAQSRDRGFRPHGRVELNGRG